MSTVHLDHLSRAHLWLLRVLVVVVLGALATFVIYESLDAPTWSLVSSALAAAAGVPSGIRIAARKRRDASPSIGWPAWAALGASGVLLASAPDRVAVIVMAFLIVLTAVLAFEAERDRRRTATV